MDTVISDLLGIAASRHKGKSTSLAFQGRHTLNVLITIKRRINNIQHLSMVVIIMQWNCYTKMKTRSFDRGRDHDKINTCVLANVNLSARFLNK